jgi:hypothetical protein
MPSFGLQAYSKHILLASSIVVVPMVTFTVVILVLVFDNLADSLHCPHEAICPEPPLVNIISSSHYYIDFPATRLVFVSSLSSTISFALVGTLMSIYAYCVADRLTKASVSPNQDKCLPTSCQTSLLIRLLNAEYLSLWELSRQRYRSGTKAIDHVESAKPTILRASIAVLCLAVLARYDFEHRDHCFRTNEDSIFVHAADSYLHIATEAVNLVQIFPQAGAQHRYGRAIDPWCLDNRETMGTFQNKNFWGCAVGATAGPGYIINKNNEIDAATNEAYGEFIMNFTEETGTKYAVLGPTNSLSDTDWQATSFALSSQCAPIPASACSIDLNSDVRNPDPRQVLPFNCSIFRGSPIDISGTTDGNPHSYRLLKFHKYLAQNAVPFENGGFNFIFPADYIRKDTRGQQAAIIGNATEQQATQMIPSTWTWTAAVSLGLSPEHSSSLPEDMTHIAWNLPTGFKMVVACNTTGECPLHKDSS